MIKRIRTTPAKPGQLKAQWGRSDAGAKPSLIYLWGGAGASKSDARIIAEALERPVLERDYDNGTFLDPAIKEGPSLAAELEARGYDLTTLKFTIEMKPK